ncbi:cuticle protein 18.7-like [Schistocerca cancellata]|uniref:cuticle protein 18.7-like n=1 Tax=Schistocerca cancellata TaxID=274614 RepID=UPI002117D186|nr:cuticle protein 18.7-like [Schistocerca cancellata]
MKALLILSSVVAMALAKPGYLGLGYHHAYLGAPVFVGDAPDVAAAKAAHLSIQAAEAARNTLGVPAASVVPADEPHVAVAKAAHLATQAAEAARNTLGVPVVPAPITADAPDVAAAKAAHLSIQAAEAARNTLGLPAVAAPAVVAARGYYGYPVGGYANIVIGPQGVPLDTPEVAAAKAANAVAHAEAAARAAASPVDPASGLPVAAYYAYAAGVPAAYRVHYDGTLLTPEGVPVDTPAVAAGKVADAVAHLQAKAALLG